MKIRLIYAFVGLLLPIISHAHTIDAKTYYFEQNDT
ncbi:type-F conjugative transfer system secretin TraK, partial [Vibrio crassostreae]|nr:type-F conjugative transfer system secretin TraK [Vibrio crassostreae]